MYILTKIISNGNKCDYETLFSQNFEYSLYSRKALKKLFPYMSQSIREYAVGIGDLFTCVNYQALEFYYHYVLIFPCSG